MKPFIFPTPFLILLYFIVMRVLKCPANDIWFVEGLAFFLHVLYVLLFYRTYQNRKSNLINSFLTLTVLQVMTVLGSTFYVLIWGDSMASMIHLTLLFLGMLTVQIFQQTKYLKGLEEGEN